MTAALPVPTWTWWASVRLEVRALGWMLGATLPVVTALVDLLAPLVTDAGAPPDPWWSSVTGALGAAVYMDAVSLIPTLAAGVVALPFTMLLGVLMRPVRHRALHIASTALLAGALAAAPLAAIPHDAFPQVGPLFTIVSLAAGAAGALARHGVFRRADGARTRQTRGSDGVGSPA